MEPGIFSAEREFNPRNRELFAGLGNRPTVLQQVQIGGPQPPLFADFRSRTGEDPMTDVDVRFLPDYVRCTSNSRSSGRCH